MIRHLFSLRALGLAGLTALIATCGDDSQPADETAEEPTTPACRDTEREINQFISRNCRPAFQIIPNGLQCGGEIPETPQTPHSPVNGNSLFIVADRSREIESGNLAKGIEVEWEARFGSEPPAYGHEAYNSYVRRRSLADTGWSDQAYQVRQSQSENCTQHMFLDPYADRSNCTEENPKPGCLQDNIDSVCHMLVEAGALTDGQAGMTRNLWIIKARFTFPQGTPDVADITFEIRDKDGSLTHFETFPDGYPIAGRAVPWDSNGDGEMDQTIVIPTFPDGRWLFLTQPLRCLFQGITMPEQGAVNEYAARTCCLGEDCNPLEGFSLDSIDGAPSFYCDGTASEPQQIPVSDLESDEDGNLPPCQE